MCIRDSDAPVRRVEDPWRRTPIGRAVAGMAVHLLDENLHPVPAGEVGQIVLTGAGRPAATSTRRS